MDRNCQHCGELIVGNAYRVTSEEEGITLLDMVVCSLCSWKQSGFGSIRRKSTLKANKSQLDIEEVTVRDSEFNHGPLLS